MEPISSFTLRPQGDGGRSLIEYKGEISDTTIDGVRLEAQFILKGEYLLFTTDDSPYEEMLHIRLVDAALHVIDAVDIGKANQPGILREIMSADDRRLLFSFFDDDRWSLVVNDVGSLDLKLRLFSGISYPRGLFRSHRLELIRER